jgi:hypothetical protein
MHAVKSNDAGNDNRALTVRSVSETRPQRADGRYHPPQSVDSDLEWFHLFLLTIL